MNGNNNQNNDFNNLLKGIVKPVTKRYKTPPRYEKYLLLGKDGDLFSKFKIWVHGATIQFPDVGIFISLNNGNGSTFSKVTLEELKELFGSLGNIIQEVESLLPVLNQEAQQVDSTYKYYQMLQHAQDINTDKQATEVTD